MMGIRNILFATILICTIFPSLQAQNLQLDPEILSGSLENGLRYYVKKNVHPERRAELRLVVDAGSILEADDQQGLAHFCEHMCFNGTKNFAKSELVDYIESIGMKFGAHLNAYTSFDETVYMLKVPTDDKEIMTKAFQILEDWAHNVSFEAEEIDKERGVVIEEWRSRLGPETRMLYDNFPIMYKGSQYPNRLPIGKKDILESFPHDVLKRFYNDWYRPDLMAVVAVGDFEPLEVEKMIKAQFSGISKPANAPERKVFDVPNHKETLVAIATDKEAPFTNVSVMYKHAATIATTETDYRQSILIGLYRSMMSERFSEIQQQADPPFVFAASGYGGGLRAKDSYQSFAMVKEDGIMRGLEAILTEDRRVLQHGFLESELQRAKARAMKQIESTYNDRDKQDSRKLASEYIRHFLTNEPAPGIVWEYEMYKKTLPLIKLSELNALPKKWMTAENVVLSLNAPVKEGLKTPKKEEMLALFNKIKKTNTTPLKDAFEEKTLLPILPQKGSIVSETTLGQLDIKVLTLSNGAKVYLKKTDFKNDEILFKCVSDGGSSIYSDEDYPSASWAADVVNASGIGQFGPTEIDKMLAGKEVQLSAFVGSTSEGMDGSTTPADLTTFMQFLHLKFTAPRKDEVAFESAMSQSKMFMKNILSQPDYYFQYEVGKIQSQDHVRSRWLITEEDFNQVKHDRAIQVYKERFKNAADFDFIFVGAFDEEELRPLLEQYVASLHGNKSLENWKDVGMRMPEGSVKKELKKGVEPKSKVNLIFHGQMEYSYYNKFALYSMVEVLKIKLRESMREDKGGVYGVGVSSHLSKIPTEQFQVTVNFNCNPANVEELITTAIAEIVSLRDNGAEKKELQKVRENMLRDRETGLRENSFWAGKIESHVRNFEDISTSIPEFNDLVTKLNGMLVSNVSAKAFKMDNYLQIVLYPEDEK